MAWRRKKKAGFDKDLHRELDLTMENNEDVYKQESYLLENYRKKVKRGKFNFGLAEKGFENLVVTPFARRYQKEYRLGRGGISAEQRRALARSRLRRYKDELFR